MKFIFIALFFVSGLALAQAPNADIPQSTPTEEKNQDIIGTIANPTSEQKKHVKEAAKKAKKKKKSQKNKKNKHKTSKTKKKNTKAKIASKKGH